MKVQSLCFFPYCNKYHALLLRIEHCKTEKSLHRLPIYLCIYIIYMCETDYKLFIISCMKVIHSNFAILTFAYIILSVFSFFLSFFHGKGLRMKKFLDFIRLEAVSPSRVKKKSGKKLISACRGELWVRPLFTCATGFVEKEGLLIAKSFLPSFDHIS